MFKFYFFLYFKLHFVIISFLTLIVRIVELHEYELLL